METWTNLSFRASLMFEGETRNPGNKEQNQIILDPPPKAAGDDELLNSL